MVPALLIVAGYAGLIATCGWWGAAAAAAHICILMAASP